MQRVVPQAACFVVPRVSSWAEFRRARGSRDLDWTTLTGRDRVAVFIPSDVSPQEVRDCLHEEVAQALGPLNDLYRLPDSVFNDDNFHAVLTGFDMLILRTYYDAELANGMTRAEVSARLPGVPRAAQPGRGAGSERHGARHLAGLDHGDRDRARPRHVGGGRIQAAERAVTIARNAGWEDTRLGFSFFALGRLTLSRDVERSVQAFQTAASIFERAAPGGIQSAHVDMQMAAFSLSAGRADEALRLTSRALPAATRARTRPFWRRLFLPFFDALRRARIPVSLREYLAFIEGVAAGLVTYDVDGFYYLARAAMVKDERHLDRFDRAFAHVFGGLEQITPEDVLEATEIPRMAGKAGRKAPDRGGRARRDRGARRLRQADGDAAQAAGGTEGPAPGRLEMDRHRRHLALRRLWLQPRGRAHRPARKPPPRAVKVWDKRDSSNFDDTSNWARATSRWR
jgi:hypothetical protein